MYTYNNLIGYNTSKNIDSPDECTEKKKILQQKYIGGRRCYIHTFPEFHCTFTDEKYYVIHVGTPRIITS